MQRVVQQGSFKLHSVLVRAKIAALVPAVHDRVKKSGWLNKRRRSFHHKHSIAGTYRARKEEAPPIFLAGIKSVRDVEFS